LTVETIALHIGARHGRPTLSCSDGAMRLGTAILPTERWKVAADAWRRAEALGFAHAWTYDHLTWRHFRERTWFSAIPVLTAAATITSTLRLGTIVASPNFRHPVTFAKEVMTLDDVSGGRVTLGIGSGGTSFDAVALGEEPWSRAERTERFEEFVDHLDALLVDERTDRLDGRFYGAVDARAIPGCVQRPRVPFAIAATGPRAMAVAARRGQAWVTAGHGLDEVGKQAAMLDEACERVGRDALSVDRILLTGFTDEPWCASLDAFVDLCGRAAEVGITDVVVHWPLGEPPGEISMDLLETIAETTTRSAGR
jgi:alkanesulfonate monooxygenase SsuD/methylene tetrahydromethanopterin reductase-like flavin-dependent oxidoreductase (luciferase family)